MKNWDGTFELVDPRDINFDRAKYQREENWPLISRIASEPDWPAFVVVPCAKREYAGGTLFAYDAQQRLLGVLASDDPPKLVPVVWWAVKSRAEEAAIFIRVNVDRRSVSPLQKFKAQLGAESDTYLLINEVVEDCGFSIGMNAGNGFKSIAAIGAVLAIYNEAGEAGLRIALDSVAEAWGEEQHATSTSMLSLYAQVLGEQASNGGLNKEKFVAALRRTTPGQVKRRAKDIQYETDCAAKVATRRAFKALGKI